MANYDGWYGRGRGGWQGRHPSERGPEPGWGRPDPREVDEWIGMQVRRNLFEDTWLDARNIEIQVRDRVVTLSGRVKDHMSARYAWDDAWEAEGVRGVVPRLEVASESG